MNGEESKLTTRCWRARGFARLGFWIPVVVILVTFLQAMVSLPGELRLILLGFLCLSLVVGFGLSLYGLLAMRRCGRKGILAYGIFGMLFYAFFIISTIMMVPIAKRTIAFRAVLADYQSKLPMKIDEYIQLDKVSQVSSSEVLYKFRLTKFTVVFNEKTFSDHVDDTQWNSEILPHLRQVAQGSDHKEALQLGLRVIHVYEARGSRGSVFDRVRFDFHPKDGGQPRDPDGKQ